MADPLEIVDFVGTVPDALLRAAAGRVRAGQGWVNLIPLVDDPEDVPRPSVWASIFGARGPAIPVCTWTRESVGIQHGMSTRAGAVLREAGITLPDGWRPVQDSPRRGIVIEIPPDADPELVVTWLVRAGTALSTVLLTGDWRGVIYE